MDNWEIVAFPRIVRTSMDSMGNHKQVFSNEYWEAHGVFHFVH